MITYVIGFLKVINDETTEREVEIQANDFDGAVKKFKEQFRVYKRITDIRELPLTESFPRTREISKEVEPFKVDLKDENFYKPLEDLDKQY